MSKAILRDPLQEHAHWLTNAVPADHGGLSPKVLLRAIERLRSNSEADVSLLALASC